MYIKPNNIFLEYEALFSSRIYGRDPKTHLYSTKVTHDSRVHSDRTYSWTWSIINISLGLVVLFLSLLHDRIHNSLMFCEITTNGAYIPQEGQRSLIKDTCSFWSPNSYLELKKIYLGSKVLVFLPYP
jgi:hypothetical protein